MIVKQGRLLFGANSAFEMDCRRFIRELARQRFADAFNPYAERCPVHDLTAAPVIRRRNLFAVLDAASRGTPGELWIGRDLGYRGGRRTGLALTDERHIGSHARKWNVACERATIGEKVNERTAAAVWRLLCQVQTPVFLWNVFPFHPHCHGDHFTNRGHTAAEGRTGEEILRELLGLLRPTRLVAIGNDAARVARRLFANGSVVGVRHPSYGGQRQFEADICELYGLGRRSRGGA